MTKVSILVPTYNRAGFLREALQSAVRQTHSDLEILILDDASPDATVAVAAEFADDPRVQYLRQPANVGIAENWRAGIGRAQGSFFCLLHDDDTFEPAFIETLLGPLLADPALLFSFCDHWVMDDAGKRMPDATNDASRRFHRTLLSPGTHQEWAELALIFAGIPVGATLFRRDKVSPAFVDARAKGAVDAWLFYQCAKSGLGAYYTKERLMNYRLHGGGMSRSSLYMGEGHIFRWQQILADSQMAPLHPQVRHQLAQALTSYGIDLLVENRRQEAQQSLKHALALQKSRRTALAYGLACGGPVGMKIAQKLRSAS